MQPYKSKSRRIRDALVSRIAGIQLNGESAFETATADPSVAFDKEPYALVFPAPSTDEKSQIGQQDRTVAFAVIILLKMEGTTRTQLETYDYMYDLTELVLDQLDEDDFQDALNQEEDSLGTWILNATRSSFTPAEAKGGAALLCTIDVEVSYSKNL